MLNYQDLAMRTLSQGFDVSKADTTALANILIEAKNAGHNADILKRSIFYTERQDQPEGNIPPQVLHAILGIISEVKELAEWFEAGGVSGTFDATNLMEELGDFEWYLALLRNYYGLTQSTIQEANIAKLRVRYPDKFNEKQATDRFLFDEMQAVGAFKDGPSKPLATPSLATYELLQQLGLSNELIERVNQLQQTAEREWPPVIQQYVTHYLLTHPMTPNKVVALAMAVAHNPY